MNPAIHAHEPTRKTHRFGTAEVDPGAPRLKLTIQDEATGRPVSARFSLVVDGEPHQPPAVCNRFTAHVA